MAGATVIRRGKATVRISGFDELFKKLSKFPEEAQQAGKEVLDKAVVRVFKKSQALAPVDPEDGGELKASGRASKARISKNSGAVRATVQYGGARLSKLTSDNPLYVIVQHEDLTLKHARGQAKFLEQPALEEKKRIMDELGKRIMEKLGRG